MTADPPSDTAKPARLPRRRVAIGPARPQYMHDVETDRMMMIVTALAAEVAALRDRLDTHEALAAQGAVATHAAVEAHVPSTEHEAEREAARMAMLRRVYRVVTEELDGVRQASGARPTWAMPEGWDKT